MQNHTGCIYLHKYGSNIYFAQWKYKAEAGDFWGLLGKI